MTTLMRQGLSRDEAMGVSYEEMWVRTRQAQFEARRDALAAHIMRLQSLTMADPQAVQRDITRLQNQIASLEFCFNAGVELG